MKDFEFKLKKKSTFLTLFLTVLFEMCSFLEIQQKEYKMQHEFLYPYIWVEENLTSENNFLDRSGLFFFKQQPPITRR